MALFVEQLCEKRACHPGSQDEDAHGVGKLYHNRCFGRVGGAASWLGLASGAEIGLDCEGPKRKRKL